MINRSIKLKGPIEKFIKSDNTLKDFLITQNDWQIVMELKTLLQPLDDITNYLSKNEYVFISNVLPDYGACLEELEKIALEYPSLTKIKRN